MANERAGLTQVVQEYGTESVEFAIIRSLLPELLSLRARQGRAAMVERAVPLIQQQCERAYTSSGVGPSAVPPGTPGPP